MRIAGGRGEGAIRVEPAVSLTGIADVVRRRLQDLRDRSRRQVPTRHLAAALSRSGHAVSHETVAQLLKVLGYSLQGTMKTLEGQQHPDRNAQFEYINGLTQRFLRKGWFVISVDTKKKELIGKYRQTGREWQRHGEPEEVLVHDFIDPKVGKAIRRAGPRASAPSCRRR
jgi:hypothetical protein